MSDAHCPINKMSWQLFKETWFENGAQNSLLYNIDPGIELNNPLKVSRSVETAIHRLRLGTVYTKAFLYKIRRAGSPTCSCGEAQEYAEHILLHCKNHDIPRKNLFQKLNSLDKRPPSIAKILGPWPKESYKPLQRVQSFTFLRNQKLL
uniref:Putative tick transposon n=1 Tax=Rhipicephalus microplus TaxID=6941 RepID=A0A6G5AI24_RHIMP